ncbi:hypothetical protein QTJ16_002248 [Diplocarpon rosae]|uniref:SRR1-like domain-containing protein n=1 Tax=Diplocarpon rosae TaxID=946125 RepID=A0AAD9WF79_9HELO|nr:hypothetical protein QTJ16_002248 [Diplocarpon rosae]
MGDLGPQKKSKTRRSRKKKADADKSPPTIVHTKRKEVKGNDGWIHIVDKPRSNKANAKASAQLLHGGDFEINGVAYIHRTLVEMKEDFDHWKRAWEERPACQGLKEKIKDIEIARKIQNVVVLGLGSLQSARREGRRASSTQLAALQTIVGSLEKGTELQLTFQDPQFTDTDKEFLMSLGYKVVHDPEAFAEVGEGSLVYAIHCYGKLYKSISERPRPAVLIGTDVENFGRFDSQVLLRDWWTLLTGFRSEHSIANDLDAMVAGCQIIDFPQLRHDFSETKIYLRPVTVSASKTQSASDAIEISNGESTEKQP